MSSRVLNLNLAVLGSTIVLIGFILINSQASADTEVIDQVRLTIPIACTMTGENTSHTATLDPGTYSGETGSEYENGIGKTTLTAICNDDNGFSIYAIGYTGNQYEGENHTKLIGQSTSSTISTKAYANGDTASNWSMKLTKVTDSTISYNPQNLTITTDYDNWHAVPDTFAKVAEYHANTGSSTTDTTLGVKLETTYAAYISSSQPADTYVGQVKYTMVHPYDAEKPKEPVRKQVAVTYDTMNAGWFGDDTSQTTNRVVYEAYCSNQKTDRVVYHTPNIDDSGNKESSVFGEMGNSYLSSINIPGASKLMIVLNYDYLFNEDNPFVESEFGDYYEYGSIYIDDGNTTKEYYGSGSQTVIVDGNTAKIGIFMDPRFVTINLGHDYGYFATVYPLDENNEPYVIDEPCQWSTVQGEYMVPTPRTDLPHPVSFYGWNGPDNFQTTDTSDFQVLQFLQTNGLPDEATFTVFWMS